MRNLLASLTVRKVVILGICLIVGGGALAMMAGVNREHAIDVATEHGNMVNPRGQLPVVSLSKREEVDAVLPFLKHLPELRELKISNVELTPEDLHIIGELNSLVTLRLATCGLTGEEAAPISKLANLTRLNLIKNPLTDRGMHFMSSMQGLERLDLRFTPIHGEGIKYLAGLPNLKELWLTDTKINDNTLARCAQLSRLRLLYVNQTDVTTEGLKQLVDMHWLEKLATPDSIPWEDRQRLANAFIASRRKARAAGVEVPNHDRPPIAQISR